MEKKFSLTVCLKDDIISIPFGAGDMLQLVKDLRDFSFIKIGDKYINKMHIVRIKFSDDTLLNTIIQCARRQLKGIEEEIKNKYDK